MVQFGVRAGPVMREIPSTSLRAGSSLRLKSGYAQDDAKGFEFPRVLNFLRFWFSGWCNLAYAPGRSSGRSFAPPEKRLRSG